MPIPWAKRSSAAKARINEQRRERYAADPEYRAKRITDSNRPRPNRYGTELERLIRAQTRDDAARQWGRSDRLEVNDRTMNPGSEWDDPTFDEAVGL